jgi:UDP-N-acetylmuramoyl-tripeptide--D-alanyl-D-alanine ligase
MKTPAGDIDIVLPMAGEHNVTNALGAAAAAMAAGASLDTVKQGLATVSNVAGRMQMTTVRNGVRLFDDSYNANPASTGAAIQFLARLEGQSWLVLGDMAELGESAEQLHQEIGQKAQRSGIEQLFCVGSLSRFTAEGYGEKARWFDTTDALIDALLKELPAGLNLLVKGSRFMGLECVVKALKSDTAEPKRGH